jgi:hypothetical protein
MAKIVALELTKLKRLLHTDLADFVDLVDLINPSTIDNQLISDMIPAVQCINCRYSYISEDLDGCWCKKIYTWMKEDGFCSEWEGKEKK